MPTAKPASDAPDTLDTEDIYYMTNLSPRMTGLPMCVWVSHRGNARHDVGVKVNMTHGNHMSIDNVAIVALRPAIRVVTGRLNPEDLRILTKWLNLNLEAVLEYWDYKIDIGQFIERLVSL